MSNGSPVATGPVATATTWIWRLATISATWWLQTLAGGIVLGLAPATAVLHDRVRAAVARTDDDGARAAWREWREGFWGSQLRLGLPGLTVFVLAWYALALRGTPFAISLAVLGAVYVVWLLHLPAVAAASERGRARELWLLSAQLLARCALPCLLAAVLTAAVVLALTVWFPGGLVLALPTVPAVATTLAVHRAVSRTTSRSEARCSQPTSI